MENIDISKVTLFMATRNISGVVHNIFDEPLAREKIVFTLLSSTHTANVQYPINRQSIYTGIDGSIDVDLWCNSEGLESSLYDCLMPDGFSFKFTLSPGLPLNFSQIRVLGTPIGDSDVSLLQYIRNQIQEISSGNGTIPLQNIVLNAANNQTVFNLGVLPVAPVRTMLFIDGVKYEYLEAYTLSDYVLTWLNFFQLSPSNRIQFYY